MKTMKTIRPTTYNVPLLRGNALRHGRQARAPAPPVFTSVSHQRPRHYRARVTTLLSLFARREGERESEKERERKSRELFSTPVSPVGTATAPPLRLREIRHELFRLYGCCEYRDAFSEEVGRYTVVNM